MLLFNFNRFIKIILYSFYRSDFYKRKYFKCLFTCSEFVLTYITNIIFTGEI